MKYTDYVNIKQGTNSVGSFSAGNIVPVTGIPFGMTSFGLETRPDALFFNPNDRVTTGIRLTHIPSPWVGDYGNFTMMAQSGDRVYFNQMRRSGFRPKETVMTPYYLKVTFQQYRATLEIAPTLRGAAGRATYEADATKRFSLVHMGQEVCMQLDAKQRRLTGYTCANTGCAPENFREYFVFQFDCDFDLSKTVVGDLEGKAFDAAVSNTAPGLSLSLAFAEDSKGEVNFTLATSFVSMEQAELNLKQELAGKSFDELKDAAQNEWEKLLSKIEIESDDEEQMKTFYTCLYRMFLFPRVFYDWNEEGKAIHYSPADGSIRDGVMYTDNGFWDTYKTVYPLYSLILSDRYSEMIDGFLNYYDESGWLPKWLSPGERGYMPGTMIDAVLADAVVKGVVTDRAKIEKMLEGMLKHANQTPELEVHGRQGIEQFLEYGYVTNNVKESVNKTLDYAYGDFCVAQIAKALGKEDLAKEYAKRALNYQNLFDKETTFMRAKDKDGKMRDDFTMFDWGWDYCEGGPWQNSFAVYHDLYGMAKLMGGRDGMIQKMDELFATPPYFRPFGYECEIHEMTEMAAVDFGQCALSNQPSFHIPYIYSCMGDKDKTAYWVRKAAAELFDSYENGYPGDEDNGSMGGWYVFTTMGFYPVCPGAGEYVLGSPCAKKCTVHLDNGKQLVIEAKGNSSENVYIQSLNKDGKEIHTTFLRHSDLKDGGVLTAEMSATPSSECYSDAELPFGLSK